MRLLELTGQRFGRLLVLEREENTGHREARWICRCDCTTMTIVPGGNLRSGNTTSCGCWHRERRAIAPLSHGHAGRGRRTTEYMSWMDMRRRCYDPARHGFKNYGSRGITVCAHWRDSFQAFLGDMGPKPSPELTLDRINNDGNYEPGNCRWATRSQQNSNRRQRKRAQGG